MFTLHIAITRPSVDAIKADLTKNLSEVKSSHRCEAMARAFGFRTYASILAATADGADAGRRKADGQLFAGYLVERGFAVDTSIFHRAVGRIALSEIMAREPQLNTGGIGAGDRRRVNGLPETVDDRQRRVEDRRADFMSDYGVEEFLRALVFVKRVKLIKRIDRQAYSYELKHLAEKAMCTYPEGQQLGPHYVSNGALIAAAIYAGFTHRQIDAGARTPSLNANFNMSPRSIRELRAELRP
ncbi:hypothetical protein MMB17_04935 [Methylobacterium organophilum]|uniref:hypothetical protein n=1 Tax=Methylobacterium organophilum TaxID=410 RepID=UPI001F12DC89|nr:hypothetical protein [Methylobacterium organophilum]UMY18675.1 hypothetical protein MMB17_04935 [Methylobacterium organophilum]